MQMRVHPEIAIRTPVRPKINSRSLPKRAGLEAELTMTMVRFGSDGINLVRRSELVSRGLRSHNALLSHGFAAALVEERKEDIGYAMGLKRMRVSLVGEMGDKVRNRLPI
jgi:hypothetical protein